MTYNYFFEISAIIMMIMILFDYRNKRHYLKRETRFFRNVVVVVLAESAMNLLSSLMISYTQYIPRVLNIAVVLVFFVLQALMLFVIVTFSFVYMNPRVNHNSREFRIAFLVFLVNALLALSSPLTHFYFYFDAENKYIQGYGSDVGYWFYLLNVILCLCYVRYNQKHLLMKDMMVAARVAMVVCIGFAIQYCNRGLLMLDFAICIAVLYMYMTLENPNDSLDKLTLCGNSYVFRQIIDEKIEKGNIFTVLYLDIRKFRFINYMHGIECGDRLLKEIALFLEQVFPASQIFRVFNDLFAVIIEKPQDSLHPYTRQIMDRFQQPWELSDKSSLTLEVMLTLCEYPKCFRSNTELTKLRTSMTKLQKKSSDTRILLSDEKMYADCIRREKVEQALRAALKNRTLQTYYQPIMNSATNQIQSLEALSRLTDGELGMISPVEFIPIAEETGLIIELGFCVLENVCRFIQEHVLDGSENSISCIHVNLSSLQCEYPNLCTRIQDILNQYEVPAYMIQLELTESAMLHSPERVFRTMETLYAKGIKFALDDYGTGYSNISYLIQFPFQEVKFDKTIVQSCFSNHEAELIVKNEFQILQQLDKRIIVEGIETKEQYDKMHDHGIQLFQGFYFSRPIPEAECAEFMEKYDA